jgi:UDP-N-acetylmuramate: L-alanyl-gamma-D-glutamyl-meso-diaminopimelate ligase
MAKPLTALDIYCLAAGGTGMAPLACLLQEQGHCIRGVDGPLYPPMSTLLERAGIHPLVGYDPAHLEPRPDLVIVGNAIHRDNPEAVAAERLGLPLLSMPQALARFFLQGRRPLVVAGTHGKTTTTALAAYVYTRCGADPGYLIGGAPLDLPASFRSGGGSRFVIEGDEYNAAYFDRGPKFLHYLPETLILTSVEHDHADLYPDPATLQAAYAKLIALLPPTGFLIACGDSEDVRRLAAAAPCPVLFYGLGANDLAPVGPVEAGPEGSRCRIHDPEAGPVELALALAGPHNVANALAVYAAARRDGFAPAAVAEALASFQGVKRRLEELGSPRSVTVVDDFAHHPTAVETTLEGLRQRYPGRRLVILFEPRSLTAGRAMFFEPYLAAFARADRVLFAPTFHLNRLAPELRLDFAALAAALTASGVPATLCQTTAEVLARALDEARPGDVLVTMSSGAFDGMPHRLLEGLRSASAPEVSGLPPFAREDGGAQPLLQHPLQPEG